MLEAIPVTVGKRDVARYRELLREDWSCGTFDKTLSLLRGLIEPGLEKSSCRWQEILLHPPIKKAPKEFAPETLSRIRDLSSVLLEPSIPAVPDQFALTRPNHLAAQAEQAWAFLILQAMANVDDPTRLFADAQSLLYLCSAHFLLPQLKQSGHVEERDCLVCAMYVHTLIVWRNVPSHMLYLQNVSMDHLENTERQIELLNMSFHLTPPDDHAYLTRATAYWSGLMTLGRYPDAWKFLWALTRHAPDSCQDEIREMLTETVAESKTGSF